MAIPVATNGVKFFIGSDGSVSPVIDFDTKEQRKDKNTGVTLWSAKTELITSQGVEAVTLKIASAVEPVLSPRTEYLVEGELVAVPWIQEGGNRPKQQVSYTLHGSLVTEQAAAKHVAKSFPSLKD